MRTYITPQGFARFEEEFRHLSRVERPKVVEVVSWAAGNGDRSENGDYIYGKKRLREIDSRLRFLLKRLENAQIVDQSLQTNRDRVYFGATVTYADERDNQRTVHLVGADEARSDIGEVSWISPIARALHKAGEGDLVKLQTPNGIEEIEIVTIEYRDS